MVEFHLVPGLIIKACALSLEWIRGGWLGMEWTVTDVIS